MNQKTKPTLILLDGNAIMHRSYHAIRPLHTKEGELVNAVFGFTSILITILTQEMPKYIACCFDTKAPTFRHVEYKEYKATRKKAPDEFYAQIPRIHSIVKALNIPTFKLDGFEADDLIGTIVTINEHDNPNVLNKIVTGDMDAFQLVTDKTCIADLHKGYKASKCYYRNDVFQKYGLYPSQIVDFKALSGDPSDNIPGVKGVGKKGATDMLQSFKSLDGIYENLHKIKGKKQDLLREQKEQAYFSQKLATIKCDVPLSFDIEQAHAVDYDHRKVGELFESLQFYSLIRRLGNWKAGNGIRSEEINDVFGASETKTTKSKKEPHANQASMF
jgi:DNA polymerase I